VNQGPLRRGPRSGLIALRSALRAFARAYWLGTSHEAPKVIDGDLIDAATGRRVRNIGSNSVVHLTGFGPDAGLPIEELEHVAQRLAATQPPGTAEVLLAWRAVCQRRRGSRYLTSRDRFGPG
jgi:hypothetical protein